jgi:hypothetical protein
MPLGGWRAKASLSPSLAVISRAQPFHSPLRKSRAAPPVSAPPGACAKTACAADPRIKSGVGVSDPNPTGRRRIPSASEETAPWRRAEAQRRRTP